MTVHTVHKSQSSVETPLAWVGQEETWGCLVACLAMILKRSYAGVRADFSTRDLNTNSYTHMDADHYLVDQGYAVARKYRPCHWNGTEREWPPAPFAEVHLCQVQISERSPNHEVVMLKDGTMLDPLTEEPRRLEDYHTVNNVAAVVPIHTGP